MHTRSELSSEHTTESIINAAVARLGDGPLTEPALCEHIHPLFSRVLARNQRTNEIYLANHSLGRPLDMIADEVSRSLDAWYEDIDGAWGHWMTQRDDFRKLTARLIGLDTTEHWKAVVPKTSAGQGLRAVINALPNPKPFIVSTKGEFDSIDFILKSNDYKDRASVRWVDSDEQGLYHADDLINAIDDQTDLVVCSLVCFVTGQLITGIERVIETAHKHNALVLIDAYHALGTLPIDLHQLGADFLIAGSYKYTRGGAGACFLAIHPRHLATSGGVPSKDSVFTTDTGWFAKQNPFAYRRTDLPEYAAGGDAWLESTPPPLVYAQSIPGLQLVNALGIDRIRAYSLHQQSLLNAALGQHSINTRTLEHRGAFLLVPTEDKQASTKLKKAGVNVDARPCPKTGRWMIRLCPDLLNTESELVEAANRIASVL